MGKFFKKKRLVSILGTLFIALVSNGCNNADDAKVDEADLLAMSQEITALSTSITCTDASEWSITAVGSKACGGPSGYIAYSQQIDTVAFLDKVEEYTQANKVYNEENGIVSDCAIEPIPVGVVCSDGEAQLVYDRCELFPDSGPCEAAFPKFYFDQEEQKCKEFLWGGCNGTVPFDTLEECQVCE